MVRRWHRPSPEVVPAFFVAAPTTTTTTRRRGGGRSVGLAIGRAGGPIQRMSSSAFAAAPPSDVDAVTLPSSQLIGDASAAAAAPPAQAAQAFEPILPDTTALLGMGSVVLLCILAGYVWSNSVVPVSRTKLAISKSRGEVKEYLDGLREDAATVTAIREDATPSVTDDALNSTAADNATAIGESSSSPELVKPNVGDGRDLERWLFSDWLNAQSNRKAGGRQKEPALPVLKDAKWNSGDNPVLVTSALLGVGVIVASLAERVGSTLAATGGGGM